MGQREIAAPLQVAFRYSLNIYLICHMNNGDDAVRELEMAKEVQMSIKMEADLRDRFMAVAAEQHRPAAHII